jgi:GT2 family glycosyltransferase
LDIIVSIVIYNTSKSVLSKVIKSIQSQNIEIDIIVIDNSNKSTMEKICNQMSVDYHFNNYNLGYGSAHNISLRQSVQNKIKYHVVLNPDVYFNNDVFIKLYNYMEKNQEVGLITPKVLYPDGSKQYLCKLLPDPIHLFLRKLLPNSKMVRKHNNKFELKFTGYDKTIDVPLISGCFMFIRTSVLDSVGFFDERYFMYFEDFDLCRRINKYFSIVLYPHNHIFHEYARGHANNFNLLYHFIKSGFKYFNKWGWFYDKYRKEINQRTLNDLEYQKNS